jgi:hypothetical protein
LLHFENIFPGMMIIIIDKIQRTKREKRVLCEKKKKLTKSKIQTNKIMKPSNSDESFFVVVCGNFAIQIGLFGAFLVSLGFLRFGASEIRHCPLHQHFVVAPFSLRLYWPKQKSQENCGYHHFQSLINLQKKKVNRHKKQQQPIKSHC